jgi:hypothetical protein
MGLFISLKVCLFASKTVLKGCVLEQKPGVSGKWQIFTKFRLFSVGNNLVEFRNCLSYVSEIIVSISYCADSGGHAA